MPCPAPTLSDPADRARDRALQRDEDAHYYREVLHTFLALATDLACTVHRQATAQTSPEPGVEPKTEPKAEPRGEPSAAPAAADLSQATIALDRLARTVRRTIALARTLSEPDRVPRAAQSARESGHERAQQQSPEQQSPEQRRAERRLAARQRALAAKPLAKLTDAELHELRAAHGLACEDERYNELDRKEDLGDGYDDDEDDGELDDALIAYACRSLGITDLPDTHPWKRVLDQVAQERAQVSAPAPEPDHRTRAAQPATGQPRFAQATAQPTPGAPRPVSPRHPGTGPPRL